MAIVLQNIKYSYVFNIVVIYDILEKKDTNSLLSLC